MKLNIDRLHKCYTNKHYVKAAGNTTLSIVLALQTMEITEQDCLFVVDNQLKIKSMVHKVFDIAKTLKYHIAEIKPNSLTVAFFPLWGCEQIQAKLKIISSTSRVYTKLLGYEGFVAYDLHS